MAQAAMRPVVVTVEEVLAMVREGRLRIPSFQRPFVWTTKQTIPFMESVLAGYPTGTLLVFRRPAEAETVRVGQIQITAKADPAALWVLDGYQRLATLAGVLLKNHGSGQPAILLAYRVKAGNVIDYRYAEEAPAKSIPLGILSDDDDFSSWVSHHEDLSDEARDLRARVLGHRLLLTELDGVDAGSAVEIFARLNSRGVTLDAHDLRHAHDVRAAGEAGVDAVVQRLASLNFGTIPPETVRASRSAVLAPSARSTGPSDAYPLPGMADVEAALETAIEWLSAEAAIPHLSVWHHHERFLPMLARFFFLNEQPTTRAGILLRRWLWRAMGTSQARPQPSLITGHDSVDASRLLKTIRPGRPDSAEYLRRVGARLALTTLEPLSLTTGSRMAVAEILAEEEDAAFRLLAEVPVFSPTDEGPLEKIVAAAAADRPAVLASHALDRNMLAALFSGDVEQFHSQRRLMLQHEFIRRSDRLAEWGTSDRPAISELLISDEDEDEDDG